MKKFLKNFVLGIILTLLLGTSIATAADKIPTILKDNNLWYGFTDANIWPDGTTTHLGSSGTRITKIWVNDLDATSITGPVVGAVDLDGNKLTFDVDGNTSMQADTDDQIDIEVAGADDFTFTANTFTALTGSTITDSVWSTVGGEQTGLVSLTDGTASWITNNLTGFTSISGTTLTDGTFSVTAGAITGASGSNSQWTNDAGYLTAETDPIVGAITGLVKANGAGVIAAAVADTDYLLNILADTSPQLGGDLDLNSQNLDFPTTADISDTLDDDTMATASATTLATSESIKAYTDAQVALHDTLAEILTGGNLSGGTDIQMNADGNKIQFGADPANDYSIEWDGTNAQHTISSGTYVFDLGTLAVRGHDDANGNRPRIESHAYSTTSDSTASPTISFKKSHSDVLDTIVETIDGERIGTFAFTGVDGENTFRGGAQIAVEQVGAATLTNVPMKMTFHSGTNGVTMVFDENNEVQIPNDSKNLYFGESQDASISYNSVNMVVNPKEVGSGSFFIDGVTVANDKVVFTQADQLEFIDSLNDGFMDYGATTAHRFGADVKLTGDNRDLFFGASDDASISYNSVNLVVNPDVVGSGSFFIDGVTFANDMIAFSQADRNEFIDSLNDGYMDYGATTAHRFLADVVLPSARLQEAQGTDVASATNITLPSDGNTFELTGTTKVDLISNVGWQEGSEITLICNESVTIDHGTATSSTNVTILLAGAGDFGCTANDNFTLKLQSTTATGQFWGETSRTAI